MIYAINKWTKEHRAISEARALMYRTWKDWHVVQSGADGWILLHGGECPLPENQRLDVKLRSGAVRYGRSGWDWSCLGVPSGTIAYRPILDDKE